MTPAIYNFDRQYAGDTCDGMRLTITQTINGVTSAVNLSGADVTFHLNYAGKGGREVLNLTTGAGTTIEDAREGICRVDRFQIPDTPGIYFHAVRILFPLGIVKTFIEGKFPVVERVR